MQQDCATETLGSKTVARPRKQEEILDAPLYRSELHKYLDVPVGEVPNIKLIWLSRDLKAPIRLRQEARMILRRRGFEE